MQQKYTFGKTKLLTIFHYSQCCVGHDASLQVRHDVTEPNLGPLACTQESQSTDTSCVVKESTVFTAGHQVRRTGSSSSKDPNFPMVFWEGVLKAVWARRLQGVWSAHAQFSARLAFGEVSSIINILVSTSLGSMFLWSIFFISGRGDLFPIKAA